MKEIRIYHRKELVEELKNLLLIQQLIARHEVVMSFGYRINHNPSFLPPLKDCRKALKQHSQIIRQHRIKHGIYECF